jgi:predicted glycogen debranching enzyme
MSYIRFDKEQLINLEYSLPKEVLRSNRAGAYANTTIINCNTRKYHGLLVTPQPGIDNDNHVLLSSFDETVIQHKTEFNLAIHKFEGDIFNPKGHKYIRNFTAEPIPKLTYRVGGVVLTKEVLLARNHDRTIIKYTLVEAHSPTILRFKPFLAYRNIHQLSRANVYVDTSFEQIQNGIKIRMYKGYTPLYMQFSKAVQYIHVPDWYCNFEYIREKMRGYEANEDLFVPGFFEASIKKGESIYFSAGLDEIMPSRLTRLFASEVNSRIPRSGFEQCLQNSAQQFVLNRGDKAYLLAGFPWFGRRGRDTFISLPGLTLTTGNEKTFRDVVDTMITEMNGPLFPNAGHGFQAIYNSADAPLWFFWALQKYSSSSFKGKAAQVWKKYGPVMKKILNGFRQGCDFNIHMTGNGLLFAGEKGNAVTWMDAFIDGEPLLPRIGLAVEINALWYNAIMFAIECATKANDKAFISEWQPIAEMIPGAFTKTFWDPEKAYLADYVHGEYKDWSVRPNMVFATSLEYSPIAEGQRKMVLDVVRSELLTSRGLRTLSPKNPDYQSVYAGNQAARDRACYQGTAWPWLIGHFTEGYLKIHGRSAIHEIEKLYKGLEETITEHGVGSISELFDGDPPHKPGGAVSMAWSVAEVLRMGELLITFKENFKTEEGKA